MRKTYRATVNKADVKCLLVRPRHRWEDTNEIDLMVRTGLMSLGIETNCRLYKRKGLLWLVEELLAYQEKILLDKIRFKVFDSLELLFAMLHLPRPPLRPLVL
jgi:hypothetical protein